MEHSSLTLQIEDSSGMRQVKLLQPVCRVGSAAGSEIRIAGTAPVALVLFQQEQQLQVLNRSGKTVLCGQQQVPSGQRVPWPVQLPLQLGSTVLTPLKVADRPAAREFDTMAGPELSKSTETQGLRSQRPQLLVIIACAILAVPLTASLLRSETSSPAALQMQVCLQELGNLLDQPQLQPAARDRLQTLAHLLQRCRMATSNGRTAEHPDRRDALAFCQSLASTELDSVSQFERQLARQLSILLAEGA